MWSLNYRIANLSWSSFCIQIKAKNDRSHPVIIIKQFGGLTFVKVIHQWDTLLSKATCVSFCWISTISNDQTSRQMEFGSIKATLMFILPSHSPTICQQESPNQYSPSFYLAQLTDILTRIHIITGNAEGPYCSNLWEIKLILRDNPFGLEDNMVPNPEALTHHHLGQCRNINNMTWIACALI